MLAFFSAGPALLWQFFLWPRWRQDGPDIPRAMRILLWTTLALTPLGIIPGLFGAEGVVLNPLFFLYLPMLSISLSFLWAYVVWKIFVLPLGAGKTQLILVSAFIAFSVLYGAYLTVMGLRSSFLADTVSEFAVQMENENICTFWLKNPVSLDGCYQRVAIKMKDAETIDVPLNQASSLSAPINIGADFALNEFVINLPMDWSATKRAGSNVYDIADEYGKNIATMQCPIREVGYMGWDYNQQSRTFQKNGITYGVDLWLGTPHADTNVGPLNALFFHRNDFEHWTDDFGYSCEIISFDAGIDTKTMEQIYKSIR